ncbi:MAG: arginine repressor [Actinomycetia bacterium]|nr:arginine repressor [Actinomycetes bacterium]
MTTEAVGDRPGVPRAQRQARVLALITGTEIASQAELSELLAADGIVVSQGTLSRDLLDVGAVRVRGASGALVYAPPGASTAADRAALEERLARASAEVLVKATASANLVVAKTPPGAAQYFASLIDQAGYAAILGTIAGDDTVLLIAADPTGGEALAAWLLAMAASGHAEPLR